MRIFMMSRGYDPLDDDPEGWIPDQTQCKWFSHAMTIVKRQLVPLPDSDIKHIMYGAFGDRALRRVYHREKLTMCLSNLHIC